MYAIEYFCFVTKEIVLFVHLDEKRVLGCCCKIFLGRCEQNTHLFNRNMEPMTDHGVYLTSQWTYWITDRSVGERMCHGHRRLKGYCITKVPTLNWTAHGSCILEFSDWFAANLRREFPLYQGVFVWSLGKWNFIKLVSCRDSLRLVNSLLSKS